MPMRTGINRRQFVGGATITVTSFPWGLLRSSGVELSIEGYLPSFRGATAWLNSQPLNRDSLRGKIVLADFWTYSCINWRRSVPYVRAWSNKYRTHGLVVVGIHSPEFQFEQDIENVGQASRAMMIDYPIAADNDLAIWRAFNNEFWPAIYIADTKGRIRHHAFGEGGYEESERVIQQLLREAGSNGFDESLVSLSPTGAEAAADWPDLRSEENYLGFERTSGFTSPGGIHSNKPHAYTSPSEIKLNHWALESDWIVSQKSIRSIAAGSRIAYRFHSRDLHVVMGPAAQGTPIRFRALIDGHAPDSDHGADVNAQGCGTIYAPRLYQLIRQEGPIENRTVAVEFLDAGAEAYSFTFG
jgi:thiol-disulfide isomerase/thioredoxin